MKILENDPTLFDGIRAGCILSDCETYRYKLWREWGGCSRVCLFILLNPSKATHIIPDPTMTRCVGFAKRWGCGRMEIVNLFAYRATDPREMRKTDDPVGPMNDGVIVSAAHDAQIIVVGWGAHKVNGRDKHVLRLFTDNKVKTAADCLGRTKDGSPRHPLRIPASQAREVFMKPQPQGDSA